MDKVKRISVENFSRCLANVDVDKIHTFRLFNYGEPLLHDNLPGIVAEIPKQCFRASVVEISTNAQWVNWDQFADMMKLEVVNKLTVSCDGDGTPEKYERLRPPAKWSKLIEFFKRTKELRDKYSPGLQLTTKTIVESRDDMLAWSRVLIPLGWQPEFRSWMILPDAAENRSGCDKVSATKNTHCLFVDEPEAFNHPWHGEMNSLFVDYDGTVVPCCMHPRAGEFGNLMDNSYSDILNGQQRRDFIRQMLTDRINMPVCGRCNVGPISDPGPTWSNGHDIPFVP